ncbi:MAG: YHS domain protein [Rhodospirillales bacterium]|nr:YHS domain protein [Rhodospirillales bacterium]
MNSLVYVAVVCLMFGFSPSGARAAGLVEINVNADGFVANGYDVVSYFDKDGPKKGVDSYVTVFEGAKYSFVSAENQKQFKAMPQKYIPAYGGYCAYGVVLGKKFDNAPDAWRIVNNVLFFQLDKGTRLIWEDNLEKNIEIGNRTWPKIKHVPANDL